MSEERQPDEVRAREWLNRSEHNIGLPVHVYQDCAEGHIVRPDCTRCGIEIAMNAFAQSIQAESSQVPKLTDEKLAKAIAAIDDGLRPSSLDGKFALLAVKAHLAEARVDGMREAKKMAIAYGRQNGYARIASEQIAAAIERAASTLSADLAQMPDKPLTSGGTGKEHSVGNREVAHLGRAQSAESVDERAVEAQKESPGCGVLPCSEQGTAGPSPSGEVLTSPPLSNEQPATGATPQQVKGVASDKVLQFSLPLRLMAEIRRAISAGDVKEITRLYYEMWPAERP